MRKSSLLAALVIMMGTFAGFTGSASAADAPSIQKDSLLIQAHTVGNFHQDYDVYSWVPQVSFRINGPVESGSVLWMDVNTPAGEIKFDLPTEEIAKGHSKMITGGATATHQGDIPEDQSLKYTGPVDFSIHVRNDISGPVDTLLYTGKFNVANVHSNENGKPDHMVYYVDQDWRLPIAYVYLNHEGADGKNQPTIAAEFWVRGEKVAGAFKPHFLYQGNEVGKIIFEGDLEMGAASADPDTYGSTETSFPVDTSQLPEGGIWQRVVCKFPNIYDFNNGDAFQTVPGQTGTPHILKGNPGDYEIKVLRDGKPSRSIKFSVGDDGKLDYSLEKSNQFHHDVMIVPVQILDDQDGQWNHDEWKTDAFYGNPLTDFTPAP